MRNGECGQAGDMEVREIIVMRIAFYTVKEQQHLVSWASDQDNNVTGGGSVLA